MSFELPQVGRVLRDLPDQGVEAGAVGTVVDLLDDRGAASEVAIADANGVETFLGAVPAEALTAAS